MTAPDRLDPTRVAQAELDGEGRLVSADPALEAVNARAGGALGQPLASPGLAAIARTAARLGIAVAQQVAIADEDGELRLWVSARPAGEGVRLVASGWEAVAPATIVAPGSGRSSLLAPAEALRWECDAANRITRLASGASPALTVAASDFVGRPIETLLAGLDLLHPGSGAATIVPTDAAVRIAIIPLTSGDGQVIGFRGTALPLDDLPPASPAPSPLPAAFTVGLDRALRRPLAQIVANADSIAQATDGPIAADYADYAADIAGAGRHLLALVDDLVDLEAVERPGFTLRPESIDLAEVARRAAGLLAVRADTAGVSISRPVPEASLPAIGDYRRALQIVANLVTNAVRYAPPGSAVVVAVAAREGRALLSVSDRGKGIAATDQRRVFEKFERVDTSEPGGNGLGLYIARRLARAMGGDLSLESAPGEGARFTLSLTVDRP